MHGDRRVLEFLNEQLTAELTAINQYFLHAKMQENWGLIELAAHTRAGSLDEMRHAESITDRILVLNGIPNYQRLFAVRIGQTVPEQLDCDLLIEQEAAERLRRAVEHSRSVGDLTSARLFESILRDEERHVGYLEAQLGLVRSLGEKSYLAGLANRPAA
ncbi:MAG: bacterioferritin [Mycobacteriales bacterium]